MSSALTLPFLLGWAAVFNPCGVAMLPATLAWLVGTVVPDRPGGLVVRGVRAGIGMTLGFTGVVAALAVLVHAVGAMLTPVMRPAMVVLGAVLVSGGGLVALGRFHFPLAGWLSVPPLHVPVRRSHTHGLMLLAGAAYGLGAVSCTLPLFVAALLPALTAGWGRAAAVVGAFGAGSGIVFVAVAEATVFARAALMQLLRRVGPWLNPVLGTVVAGSGGYLVYYWVWGPGHWLGLG